jgi:tRNA(Ile)-lysidine synthase TilS/MesJ
MDPGFNSVNLDMLKENCDYLNIPVKIFKSDIFKIVDKIAADYPCYMCARMRRGALYSKAQELGCNKLALGHHFDDVIETTLLNVFYAGTFKTMLPKLKSKNFKGLELIRPMYYIHEEDIIRFTLNSGINPMNCGCIVAAKKTSSKRREIKRLIKELKKTNENIGNAILKATQNVNLDGLLGWKFNGQSHSFLDYYTDKVDQDIVED